LSAEVDELVNLCERLKDVCVYDDALRILRECVSFFYFFFKFYF